jgi:hypothetical protein
MFFAEAFQKRAPVRAASAMEEKQRFTFPCLEKMQFGAVYVDGRFTHCAFLPDARR